MIEGLRLGMTVEDVRDLLGPPDDVGGTSRKYPSPSIYVYGSIELFFTRSRPALCHSVGWYTYRGGFRLAAGETNEQFLSPGMLKDEVEALLRIADLSFTSPSSAEGTAPTLVMACGVPAIFNDDRSRYAVMARHP